MNKGLEIINLYENSNYLNIFHPNFMKDLQIVKKELERLEAIDSANPSEALEWLQTREQGIIQFYGRLFDSDVELLKKIEPALLKAQEQEKVLEIIKNKTDLSALIDAKNVDDFNFYLCCEDTEHEFTEEEFDLLKQYFEKNIQK